MKVQHTFYITHTLNITMTFYYVGNLILVLWYRHSCLCMQGQCILKSSFLGGFYEVYVFPGCSLKLFSKLIHSGLHWILCVRR